MGLDMYVQATSKKNLISDELNPVIRLKKNSNKEQVFYWRKHPALHGWMHNKYLGKLNLNAVSPSEDDLDFNGPYLRIDENDLDELENDLNNFNLPWDTTGFFFGSDNPQSLDMDKEEKERYFKQIIENDLEFISKSRTFLKKGLIVLYNASY